MQHLIRRLGVALLFALAASAHASFVARDSSFGANTLILDTDTGLQWLRFDQTVGLPYNDIYSQLGTTFAGFRLADSTEVSAMVTGIGIGNGNASNGPVDYDPPQSVLDATYTFMTLFGARGDGVNFLGLSGYVNSGPPVEIEPGFFRPPFLSFFPYRVFWFGTYVGYDDDSFLYGPNVEAVTGAWMVSTAPPIPEPSTYALMLAGLGVVGVVARRRRVQRVCSEV